MGFVLRLVVFFFVGVSIASVWNLSFCATSDLPAFEGTVVGITDGDTLTVLRERQQLVSRLVEIDAPERGQPFGRNSTQSLTALCAGQAAQVQWNNMDGYNRILGRVHCRGVDANAEQVRRGMAWVYDQYMTDRSLYRLQDAAKAGKVGLWSDKKQIPPWEWRRMNRQ